MNVKRALGTRRFSYPLGIFKSRMAIILALIAVAIAIKIGSLGLAGDETTPASFGILSLLPTVIVLVFALTLHRTVEALCFGSLIGLVMLKPSASIANAVELVQVILADETIVWVILVCSLLGALIIILEKSGSITYLSQSLGRIANTAKRSLFLTYILGLFIFIDDYLNAVAISSSMRRLTDSYKISREKLAYIVDSTAAPICILMPLSTWAVFFSGLLSDSGIGEKGSLDNYISAIPFMVYGWLTLIIVPVVALGFIPDFGPMKKAEERAKAGQPKPDGVKDIDFSQAAPKEIHPVLGVLNFLLPMGILIFASIYLGGHGEIDLLAGVIVALLFTIVYYDLQGLIPLNDIFDSLFDGIKIMLLPLATVFGGFMLKNVNDRLGFTEFVIDSVTPYLTTSTFPAIIFVVMLLLVFVTGSSWGLFVIAIPTIVPLALAVNAHIPLVIGAILSASAAGSHACFFSDSTVLTAQSSGCTAMQHAKTQLPYALLGIVITFTAFLFLGYYFA